MHILYWIGMMNFDKVVVVCLWRAERVSPHKRLRGGIDIVDSIPRTPSGKIIRRLLSNGHKSKAKL